MMQLVTCCWCGFLLGVAVTAASLPTPAAFGAGMATIAALVVALAATSDYLKQP